MTGKVGDGGVDATGELNVANLAKMQVFVQAKRYKQGTRITAATVTRALSILGTPNYMSPEQATGMVDEIDHRTDQWTLACITWEMLSGRSPFAADELSVLLYQIINLAPQPWCPESHRRGSGGFTVVVIQEAAEP